MANHDSKPLNQLLTQEQLEFPEFAKGFFAGLGKAIISDPEVFAMALSGFLLGRRDSRPRGFGIALAMWVAARRADQYVGVLDSKLGLLSRVIHEGNPHEESK